MALGKEKGIDWQSCKNIEVLQPPAAKRDRFRPYGSEGDDTSPAFTPVAQKHMLRKDFAQFQSGHLLNHSQGANECHYQLQLVPRQRLRLSSKSKQQIQMRYKCKRTQWWVQQTNSCQWSLQWEERKLTKICANHGPARDENQRKNREEEKEQSAEDACIHCTVKDGR